MKAAPVLTRLGLPGVQSPHLKYRGNWEEHSSHQVMLLWDATDNDVSGT